MERLDLNTRQFTQAEVLQILPNLSGKTLQNWKSRGVLDDSSDAPGKGNRRLYTGTGIVMLDFMSRITNLGIQPAPARKMASKVATCAHELWNLNLDIMRQDGMREITAYADGNDAYRRGFIFKHDIHDHFVISRNDQSGSISPRIYIVVAVDLLNIAVLNLINRHLNGLKPVEVHIESTFGDEGPDVDARRELFLSKIKTLPVNPSY